MKHVTLTKVEQKRNAVKHQDVRHVSDAGVGDQLHLLLGRGHEEEPRRVEQLHPEVSAVCP